MESAAWSEAAWCLRLRASNSRLTAQTQPVIFLPLGGQHHAAPAPLEEGHAPLLLQLADIALTEGWVR